MLSAVNYLHENGIVHRDLKLENFLFEDSSPSSPLILIDFGLSKHIYEGEKLSQKVGSCYYTAPEVLNGPYDAKCDVWSVGVLCYMLLSGSPPFFGKTVDDVYVSIQTKEATFTDKKFKHVSNSCLDFMKRLLTRDVRQRVTAAEALLHPFITGAPFFPRYQSMHPKNFDDPVNAVENSSEAAANRASLVFKSYDILESLIKFASLDPMSKCLFQMFAHSFGCLQLQKFREEFRLIDRNYTGKITKSDFVRAFSMDNINLGKWSPKDLFDSISSIYGRPLPHIGYHQYIAAAMVGRIPIAESRLDMIYSFLDVNKVGTLTFENLSNALGYEVSQQNIMMQNMKMIINHASSNVNGSSSNSSGGMNERTLSKSDIITLCTTTHGSNSYRK